MSGPMMERIGKYRIVERVGRGGMGVVLKAHDPVLDRTVALKIISSDIEVTDELRARFFREAQACARLSHPNIVTVYDLVDAEGHLFIVMEFLDGQELKQVIAQRRPLPLEDKLAIMIQVCDGLAYAHLRGVVHRDVKPGNIFLLTSGTVKILDFGIARIATAEAGLTRTGLIMGTLRYIAPEQARGRADHRADIFSVGAVFYELLSYRPAFEAEDPMEILEALRSHEPPLLSELDPTIPAEVAEVIAGALRKDPDERIQELGEMRRVFETTRRVRIEEAERVRIALRPELHRLRELHSMLRERLTLPVDDSVAVVEQAVGLNALKQLAEQVADRIPKLQNLLARADGVEPAVRQALGLKAEGNFAAVVDLLEPVVRDVPEHAIASAALSEAREHLERERRREEALRRALDEARHALERGAFSVCFEQLNALLQAGVSPQLLAQVESVRRDAEAARAAYEAEARRREEMRRARTRAEQSHAEMIVARRIARDADAAQTASATWNAAERRAAEGHAALESETLSQAFDHFGAALQLYRSATAEAHEVQRSRLRPAAEAASAEMVDVRRSAEAAGARVHATATWQSAVVHEERGHAAFLAGEFEAAAQSFGDARQLYELATRESRDAQRRHERESVERERQEVAHGRRDAERAEASVNAPAQWNAAEGWRGRAEQAAVEESYDAASQHYAEALAAYRAAVTESEAIVLSRQRLAAEAAQRRAGAAREAAAEAAAVSSYARDVWSRAESSEQQAMGALQRGDFVTAREMFDRANEDFQAAVSTARVESVRQERERAERAREEMNATRAAAYTSGARERAGSIWNAAEAKCRHGESAYVEEAFGAAHDRFVAAATLYHEAEAGAREVAATVARERAGADGAAARTASARDEAAARLTSRYAPILWAEALDSESRAVGAVREGSYQAAIDLFETAATQFRGAADAADRARQDDARRADALVDDACQSLAAGDYSDALARAQEALGLVPAHARAAEVRAAAERELQREVTRDAVARLFTEAQARLAADDLEAAIRLLQEILDRDPGNLDALQTLDGARARVEREAGKRPGASAPVPPVVTRREADVTELRPTPTLTNRVPRAADRPAQPVAPKRKRETPPTSDESRPTFIAKRRRLALTSGAVAIAGTVLWLVFWPFPSARDPQHPPRSKTTIDLQAVILELQADVGAAKRAADASGARDAARGPWEKAEALERQAEAAFNGQRLDDAYRLLRDAKQLYGDAGRAAAELTARRSIEERDSAEALRMALRSAEEARAAAERARASAEQANAPRHAASTFRAASEREAEGRANFGRREYAVAQSRFREAERDFVTALNQASRAIETERQQRPANDRERSEIAALKRRVVEARRSAEQSDADRLAPSRMVSARARDREGQTLLERDDLARAKASFQAAESEFQVAAQESHRAADTEGFQKVAQARQAASERRQVAEKAGADMLAKEIFDRGSGRFREGDTFAQARKWSEAAQAYRDAAGTYGAADKRVRDIAEVRIHADTTKEHRERAVRAGAERRAKDLFDSAAARHTEADRAARGENVLGAIPMYIEATERYRAAERAASPVTTPPKPDAALEPARQEIFRLLADYSRAFETKDAELLRKLRPGLSTRQLDEYREIWNAASTFRVVLNPERLDIRGDEADVTGRREDIIILKDGRRERGAGERTFWLKMKRGKDGWAIETVN